MIATIGEAEDVAEIMGLGASGALLGTRFLATTESLAHDEYKQALIDAGPDSTARSEWFDGGWPYAPHRNLKTPPLPPGTKQEGPGPVGARGGRHRAANG